MICSNCGKEGALEYELADTGRSVHLCVDCYNTRYGGEKEFFDSLFVRNGGLAKKTVAVCPVCGTTSERYRASGLVGCEHCYDALKEELLPVIRRLQRSDLHVGKAPVTAEKSKGSAPFVRTLVAEQEALKAELERAIGVGDFARAEQLRERLIEINHKL